MCTGELCLGSVCPQGLMPTLWGGVREGRTRTIPGLPSTPVDVHLAFSSYIALNHHLTSSHTFVHYLSSSEFRDPPLCPAGWVSKAPGLALRVCGMRLGAARPNLDLGGHGVQGIQGGPYRAGNQ